MLKSTLHLESKQKIFQQQNRRMYTMSFTEIYDKLDRKGQIDERDEIELPENNKEEPKLELSDIRYKTI